ncbi:MAG: DUF479 domain-containing protein [Bacteroidia bacterium]|nr:DUF479 domain-containing protein [Bacteroidia bacterium]NNC86466.1 DUF479 domain-containing protein [Bacteroidia bacterium]NNM15014.1 DUF479 domain-containing protein [Bacteroidia bacterium]
MNYLAHIYLSGTDEELMIGNFLGDHVRGNQFPNLTKRMVDGIYLHRFIDTFTDSHEIVRESKLRLRPNYGKYASVIVDIYYDHFLAYNWKNYHEMSLPSYTKKIYGILNKHHERLPERTKMVLSHMSEHNWLLNYAELEGMEKALRGISKRTKFESNIDKSIHELKEYYTEFEKEFSEFFPDLIKAVEDKSGVKV